MARPRFSTLARLELARPAGPEKPAAEAAGVWADGAVTVPEACTFLRLDRTTVDKLRHAGRLVWARHGRKILVARRSLVEYLRCKQVGGGA